MPVFETNLSYITVLTCNLLKGASIVSNSNKFQGNFHISK